MKNFTFANPVKIIFGKDTIGQLSKEIPANSKVLLIYGGGSIKKNGVYDQVVKALAGFTFVEFAGIEPNPHYETCMEVAAKIKAENIDFLLAVGGGSVIDATKFIAAAARFSAGDPWSILSEGKPITDAVPFGTVLTLSATASEMNGGGVITKAATQEKLAFGSDATYPRFSVLDPTVTYSVPAHQVANGVVDAFVHILEQYLTFYDGDSMVQDYMAEGFLKVIVTEGRKVLTNLTDYDIRANLMWASTWGLNNWISRGVPEDWTTHMIGHELTAFYGIDHAQTLAVVLPGVMEQMREQKSKKIQRLGKEVFGIQEADAQKLIDKTIVAVEAFFHELNVKTRLSDYNVGEEVIAKVEKRMADRGWKLGECQNITPSMVAEILKRRL